MIEYSKTALRPSLEAHLTGTFLMLFAYFLVKQRLVVWCWQINFDMISVLICEEVDIWATDVRQGLMSCLTCLLVPRMTTAERENFRLGLAGFWPLARWSRLPRGSVSLAAVKVEAVTLAQAGR